MHIDVMSNVAAHITKATNTDISVIPGGLTSQLQPADVSWNKPFTQAYKAQYNEWMVSGEKSYTAAGNLQPPDMTLCLKWVKEAWKSVSIDVIKKSLVACGISSSLDGSQDTEISCIKVGGIAAEAAATISAQTQELLVSADEEQDDPFANCEEDEDKLEENETVVHEWYHCWNIQARL